MYQRKNAPAALRFAERRRREDDAPRLKDQVPMLASLKLELEERTGIGATKYVRRVSIEGAPALFIVPCGDPKCADGEHDLTTTVMRALLARETTFRGEDECPGSLGPSPCPRVLHFDAVAEYKN